MTQHIRELLDGAVARVEPRVTDPVPAVVRRARSQRLRALIAGAMACAALLGGGVAVAAWSARDRVPAQDRVPATATPVSATPPTPRLVDGNIVAGGVVIPVPAGMQVVTPDWPIQTGQTSGCVEKANTVAISGPDTQGCAIAPIEIYGKRNPAPPGGNALTLAGGEPAWLMTSTTDDWNSGANRAPGAAYYNLLVLPWTQLFIVLRIDGAAQQRFIDSLRTTPEHGGRLVLPGTAGFAEWTISNMTPRPVREDHRPTTDPNTVAAVLRLLGQQRTVLDNRNGECFPTREARGPPPGRYRWARPCRSSPCARRPRRSPRPDARRETGR